MRWRKISLGFATLCLVELATALGNEAVFEAQFLNVSEELKIADEKYGGYEIIEHRVSHRLIDPLRTACRASSEIYSNFDVFLSRVNFRKSIGCGTMCRYRGKRYRRSAGKS